MAVPSKLYPVILFNVDHERNIGNIRISSDLIFKQFQLNLSQLLGISYNNLTTYLIDQHKSDRRKILITGKVNFGVLVNETMRNSYFLMILKRSRRDRRKKLGFNYNQMMVTWHQEDQPYRYYDNEDYVNVILNNFPRIDDVYSVREVRWKCKECLDGRKEFHCCVYDEVVYGFRTVYGPIAQPVR